MDGGGDSCLDDGPIDEELRSHREAWWDTATFDVPMAGGEDPRSSVEAHCDAVCKAMRTLNDEEAGPIPRRSANETEMRKGESSVSTAWRARACFR